MDLESAINVYTINNDYMDFTSISVVRRHTYYMSNIPIHLFTLCVSCNYQANFYIGVHLDTSTSTPGHYKF